MRAVRLLNFLLLAALFAGSLLVWPDLPQQIPVHFGLGGKADRWSESTLSNWMMIPLVALGLTLLLYGFAFASASRNLPLTNMPDSERYERLPPDRQRAVRAKLSTGVEILCLPLIFIFCYSQVAIYRTSTGNESDAMIALIAFLAMFLVPMTAIFAIHLRVQSEITRQDRIERGLASAESG